MPFSWASFFARGDAATRPPSFELRVFAVVCCFSFFSVEVVAWSVLVFESSFFVDSFSFFSVFSAEVVCSSDDDFAFAVDNALASSLKSLNAAMSSSFSTIIAHN